MKPKDLAEQMQGLGAPVLTTTLANRDPGVHPDNLGACVAVAPRNVAEVQAVLKYCSANKIAVVTHGGRTSLAGAAASEPGQVVLLTDQLGDQIEINTVNQVATIGAGVTLQTAAEQLAEHGLSLGVDLAARGSCTIGGMISTNAGGMEAFRNGVTRQRILGLEVVMPDGQVMSDLKQVMKANEGYDLKQLFIGAEGTLGVVTRAALRLIPIPRPGPLALVAFDSASDAVSIFNQLRARFGPRLLLAEVMWRRYFIETCREIGADRPAGIAEAELYVVFQIEGDDPDELAEALIGPMEDGVITDAVLAKNETEAEEIMRVREDTFALVRKYPHGLWFDISVPLDRLDGHVATMRQRIRALDETYDLSILGHLGDGNLHITVLSDGPIDHLKDAATAALCDGLPEIGGSFSAEHGIGTEKRAALGRYGDPVKLLLMQGVKAAFDPQNIMNPGKVLP